MKYGYTNEKNILQLIALLKKYGVRKVVASPGGTNVTFVGSIQSDPFFEIFSCVDERSAAYLACGIAEESGEPVIISCTGATAARNYASALTEAYYRKLPVIAITSSQHFCRTGHLFPQFTDRSVISNDVAKLSVHIPFPNNSEEYWANNININKALLELKRNGGGPVHINISTSYSRDFSVDKLPDERIINRITNVDKHPDITDGKILIFVGSHNKFDSILQNEVDEFCEKYNAVVLCDHTSNYKGKYRHLGGLIGAQNDYFLESIKPDLIIHIGEITGSYYPLRSNECWRVSPDGEIRDTFKSLTIVFDMTELEFFKYYNGLRNERNNTYLSKWKEEEQKLQKLLPELPFSNPWVAYNTSSLIPDGAVVYLGILNSLRSWNLFQLPNSVYSYSTVGGFGIDGLLSSCVGASFANPNKLFFCVLGDLSTFYDINILGNRHINRNLRILVINNGTGFEMHNQNCVGSDFGEDADTFFAAGGHFGNKSEILLKNFVTVLGFEYISARNKEEYKNNVERFVTTELTEKPLFFEAFIDEKDENQAFDITKKLKVSSTGSIKGIAKKILGPSGYEALKANIKK